MNSRKHAAQHLSPKNSRLTVFSPQSILGADFVRKVTLSQAGGVVKLSSEMSSRPKPWLYPFPGGRIFSDVASRKCTFQSGKLLSWYRSLTVDAVIC